MTFQEKFKLIFKEEFDDPNESFLNFLLSLISTQNLKKVIKKGNTLYYDNIEKY